MIVYDGLTIIDAGGTLEAARRIEKEIERGRLRELGQEGPESVSINDLWEQRTESTRTEVVLYTPEEAYEQIRQGLPESLRS